LVSFNSLFGNGLFYPELSGPAILSPGQAGLLERAEQPYPIEALWVYTCFSLSGNGKISILSRPLYFIHFCQIKQQIIFYSVEAMQGRIHWAPDSCRGFLGMIKMVLLLHGFYLYGAERVRSWPVIDDRGKGEEICM